MLINSLRSLVRFGLATCNIVIVDNWWQLGWPGNRWGPAASSCWVCELPQEQNVPWGMDIPSWVYVAKCLAHAGGCRDVWREPKPGHHRHAAFPCSSQLRKAIPVSSPGSHLSIYSRSFCFLFACSNPHFSPSPQLWQPSLPWYLSAWIEESLWHPFFGTGKVQYSGSTFKLFNGFESHGFLQAGSRASC